jgi:hypothetical protein
MDNTGSGNLDSTEATAIKITTEMIAAGVCVLREHEHFLSLSPTIEKLLVRKIVAAALAASFGESTSHPKVC